MEIKVVHEIRFAKETASLFELVATALVGAVNNTQVPAPSHKEEIVTPEKVVNEAPVTETTETANVAEKLCYFQHDASGELIKVAKGESLDFLETDSFTPLKPVEYNRLLAEQKKAEEAALQEKNAPVEQANDPVDDAEGEVIPTIEDLRVIAAKFQANKQQKELKAILDDFGAAKLSAIAEEDRAEARKAMQNKLDELGIE